MQEVTSSSGTGQARSTPSTSKTSHPVDSDVLFQGVDPIADIVFVHGLRGHRRDTWTKDNVCWPQELLSKEESLSHVRVLTLGYDANIVSLNGHTSLNTLFQHSINLVQELSRVRKDALDRPIIFVAHSLGGLIVKDALDYSNRVQDTHPHLAWILSATRGIIFLGTPHRGSGMTSIAKVVASVAQMALQNPPLELIPDLERDSQTLDRIGDSFSKILAKPTLTVWSFAEELAITEIGTVVPSESAIIGDPRENRETIYGDHISIVKFSRKDDLGYKKVLNAIEMLLEGLGEDNRMIQAVVDVKTFYSIPPLRVTHFVGRETLYARLQTLFDCATTPSSPLIVVLIGMGGAGKTQLALEYCQRMKNSRRAIFWVDASSHNTLYSSMKAVAKQLLPDQAFNSPSAAIASVNDVLSSWSERWLLVFDNIDNAEDLAGMLRFFSASHRGSILITSRHVGSKELGQSIELDRMEKKEGLQLLLRSSEIDAGELDAAEQILNLLGDLPMAIDQARAYISKRQLRLRAFVAEFERRKQSVMQANPYRHVLPDKEKETSFSLLTTWEMSLQLLGVGERTAELEKVITLFAFFDPVKISERLFSNDTDDWNQSASPMSIFKDGVHWNHSKFEDAVVNMQELSLLQISPCNGNEITISLHSMVSEWLRMRLEKSSQRPFLNSAMSHLKCYLDSMDHSDHQAWQEGQAHIDTIWRGVESFNLDDDFLDARVTFGNFYRDQGRLRYAEMMYDCALAGFEKTRGPEHTSTLDIVNELGLIYADQGRHIEAEMMYSRALAGYEKACGLGDMTTLNTVKNMGNLYNDQGRHKDAEMMYSRALTGYERGLGPEHMSTLDTVNKLGLLYDDQGRVRDAEMMYNRALTGFEKVCGSEHTTTLDTVYNLGLLCAAQGRHKDAEIMYRRALAGFEKAWGPEHASTLDTVNNLGNIYAAQGRHKDAEMMYNRALAGKEKAWGLGHTITLDTVNNLGVLYAAQGRHNDAEMMYNRALAGKEKALGPDHTSTLDTVNNMGLLHASQGRYNDAEMMYTRVLAGYEKAWGPEHTSTLGTTSNLGNLYKIQGRHKDAEMMYNRVLAGYERAWGPDHTSTLNIVNNLALLFVAQGRYDDAEMMYNRALAGFEKAWGPDHTTTLHTVNNLGNLYKRQGRHKDAETMYNRALAGYERAWGPEHTSTLDMVNNLGSLYVAQGRHKDAEIMYNRALSGFEKVWGPEHMSTLGTVNNLGVLYAAQGRHKDAEMMYNRALAGYEKIGHDHTFTLSTVNNLGLLCAAQGRHNDAEMLFNRALAGYEKAWGPRHMTTLDTVNYLGDLYKTQGRHKDAKMMYNRALAAKEGTRAVSTCPCSTQ